MNNHTLNAFIAQLGNLDIKLGQAGSLILQLELKIHLITRFSREVQKHLDKKYYNYRLKTLSKAIEKAFPDELHKEELQKCIDKRNALAHIDVPGLMRELEMDPVSSDNVAFEKQNVEECICVLLRDSKDIIGKFQRSCSQLIERLHDIMNKGLKIILP